MTDLRERALSRADFSMATRTSTSVALERSKNAKARTRHEQTISYRLPTSPDNTPDPDLRRGAEKWGPRPLLYFDINVARFVVL
ncbi:hypothetical protein G7K_1111-t1 [Saitoella complicata NRRL Y-17804]|uniref:Uncharacterized protein n=1 Tax=Saitoella complicata (strain BCRC 22490 / CBS 7301 / JCM 7358 / NBRC 10748 / NRRL Y-17804) TaxID=698492 RepID=A0A0E9NAS2_SAICN|nr:hypothetical protein G7K_1111-t1 [Saitoella complicata NRRL Y-17804]